MHSHLLSGILVVIKEQKVKVGKTVYWGGGVSMNSEHPSHKFFEGDFLHILYLQKASPLPGWNPMDKLHLNNNMPLSQNS